MTIKPVPIHEQPGMGGDDARPSIRDGIASYLPQLLHDEEILTPPSQELGVSLEIENNMVDLTSFDIEAIEPSDKPGWYELRIKDGLSKKQKIAGAVTLLITGASLLAGAKQIYRRHKN